MFVKLDGETEMVEAVVKLVQDLEPSVPTKTIEAFAWGFIVGGTMRNHVKPDVIAAAFDQWWYNE